MKNQVILSIQGTQRQAVCPITVKAGDAVLLGTGDPAVAINDYEAIYGGTTFELTGSYVLTVIGRSTESPVVTKKIFPGDKIYAVGTLDSVTGVTTGLTLDANSATGALFGTLDPQYQTAVAAGATDTAAWVRLG